MNRLSIRSKNAAWATFVTAAALCLTLAPAAAAQEVAQVRAGSGGLDFLPVVEHGGFVLTVSGPEGFHHRAEFGSGESPSFSIYDHAGGVLPDGVYNYDLRLVPNDAQRRDAFEANQVATKAGAGLERPVQSGAFSIVAGSVVAGGETEPGQRPEGSGPVLAPKTTILTTADGSIINSLCVGNDCTSSETFGFDTIRLKENNTRIKFEDTSVGSFPSTDWQLTANDSASGGQNRFSIEDITTARVPFTVEGGSTTNSIYVDSTGRVGFRTSTPVLDIHVATSNTPGMRLEQTSAGGFTAQTWDIAGNEANFFVRSVTTGSQLPFRIRPGAPTSSIDIASSGNVGIGTAAPDSPLHVRDSTSSFLAALNLQNAGGDVGFRLTNDLDVIDLNLIESGGLNELRINLGASPPELALTATGDMTITGDYFSATCTAPGLPCAPDYVFAPDYELMPLDELRTFVEANRHLPNVPSEADLKEARQINLSKFQLTLLEKVEELTLYTLALHETIEELKADRDAKSQTLTALEAKLAGLVPSATDR